MEADQDDHGASKAASGSQTLFELVTSDRHSLRDEHGDFDIQKSTTSDTEQMDDSTITATDGDTSGDDKDKAAQDTKKDTENLSDSGKEEKDNKSKKDTEGKDDKDKDDDPEIDSSDPKGVQKKINKITKKRRDAERRAELAEQNNAELKARIETLEKSTPNKDGGETETTAKESTAPVKPKVGDYDDYDNYIEALSDYTEVYSEWKANKIVDDRFKERDERDEKEKNERDETDRAKALDGLYVDARKKYSDFDEVALDEDVSYSPAMVAAMSATESLTDIAYYLGGHQDIAYEISQLDPVAATLRIGSIEAEILSAANNIKDDGETDDDPDNKDAKEEKNLNKKVTNASKPPETISGGSSTVVKDPNDMNMAEYRKYRQKQKDDARGKR